MPAKQKYLCAAGTVMGWFAVIAQLVILLNNRRFPLADALIQFISYFTILTNTLVAVYFSCCWLRPNSKWGTFFSSGRTGTAIAIYITVVGLVYNIILRQIWNPEGLQKLVDELLHTVIPLFFILYWVVFISKNNLHWKNIFMWLLYPFVYFVYILTRGAITNLYPYPFIDVGVIGYSKAFINSGIILLVFTVLSLLFIVAGRWMSKKN